MNVYRPLRIARPLFLVALGALPFGALSGCSDAGSGQEPGDPGAEEVTAPTNVRALGEMVVHVDPRAHTMRTVRFQRYDQGGPGLHPENTNGELTIENDGVAGTGSANTVELDTDQSTIKDTFNPGETCPGVSLPAHGLCADVTLRHFYSSGFNNVYVQVESITDSANKAITGHDAINSSTGVPSYLSLSATHGLWRYTASSGAFTADSGNLGKAAADAFGKKTWVFNNVDDGDFYLHLKVYANVSYASYNFTKTTITAVGGFTNACTSGTNLGAATTSSQTLPFPFTLYNSTNTTLNISKRGTMSLGSVAVTPSNNNTNLPETGISSPKPGIFAFWDDITYNGSGTALCVQSTGSAPNRKYVVTWQNLKFTGDTDLKTNLTFSAYLYEGTDRVDFLYRTMTSTVNTGINGNSATVGIQSSGGTTGTGATKPTGAATNAAVIGDLVIVSNSTAVTLTPVP